MRPKGASRRVLEQQSVASPATAAIQPVQASVRTGNAPTPEPELSPAGSPLAPHSPRVDAVKKASSAEQLSQAMEQGASHILLTAHMDLYHLPAKRLVAMPSTVSMRGSCPSEPSSTLRGASALPKRTTPTQCVIRVPAGLLSAASAGQGSPEPPRLWLDNLLVTTATGAQPKASVNDTAATEKTEQESSHPEVQAQLTIQRGSRAWLTNVVLDSGHDGAPAAPGLDVQAAARVYARNITITGGSVHGPPLISIKPAATLLLNHTTLAHIGHIGPHGGVGSALRVRTPSPAANSEPAAAPAEVVAPGAEPRVWLEGSLAPPLVEALGGSGALVFSDSVDAVDDEATGGTIAAQPLEGDVAAAGFLSESSPWFQQAKRMAMGNTSVPYFLASGAQELLQAPEVRAEAARSAPHQARVRVTYTNASSAVVLVPSILAAILFAGVVVALTFKFIRTRSHRRRSLPSTMDKSMSGTEKSVQSGHAVGSSKDSGDRARGAAARASTAGSDDGEIAAAGPGHSPLAVAPRPRAAYALASVPEPHSLRATADGDVAAPAAAAAADLAVARSGPFDTAGDAGDGSFSRHLHGEGGSSPGNSARGSLSFSYSQLPDSPASGTSTGSHLSHTSWPAGPRTMWDASRPLSRSITLYSPAHLFGPASPAPIGRPVASADTPPGSLPGAVSPTQQAELAAGASRAAALSASGDGTRSPPDGAGVGGAAYATPPRSGSSVSVRDDISTFSIGLPGPPASHIPDERDQALTAALDSMHADGELLGELFEVLPSQDRRFGRHGVVQPLRRTVDGAAMAAKFFRDRAAFEAELHARSMLPRSIVLATKLVDRGTIRSGNESEGSDDSGSSSGWNPPPSGGGAGLPPHIVMDRGVPLKEWAVSRGATSGFSVRVQVVQELAQRLATMHAAGWMHGAVKPGNVLWREIGGQWLLTDVCDAARIGKKVAVTCVPPLSPPEAATAVREQQEVPAAGATDVWAAGVIACQLLAPAATAHASLQPDSAAAWDAACGRAPFPWEPASPLHKACVAELLSAADAVLACVSRTPGDRPTSAQLVGLLGDVLAAQEQAGP